MSKFEHVRGELVFQKKIKRVVHKQAGPGAGLGTPELGIHGTFTNGTPENNVSNPDLRKLQRIETSSEIMLDLM